MTGASPATRVAMWARPYASVERLPPDATYRWRRRTRDFPMCGQRWGVAWHCTRKRDHGGRHAAGDGEVVRAVWR